ncbi:hypothetical protein QOZ80_7BG0602120 [Eleusine coracana subsp. coracana]|nr:hypothetical protein QOZ80_7BG0602120 [Eleusine coracana subsp. coracana]
MNSSLLSLGLLLLVSVSPHAAARPVFPESECIGDVTYAADSTYEANLRRLASVLPAAVSASRNSYYTYRAAGFWPNRVQASSLCRRGDDDDSSVYISGIICENGACYGTSDHEGRYTSCAACIAGAFRELESACPYYKEAFFSNRNCTLQLSEVQMFDGIHGSLIHGGSMLKQIMKSGLIFQVIGFAWLIFLLLQEWHGRKQRGTVM